MITSRAMTLGALVAGVAICALAWAVVAGIANGDPAEPVDTPGLEQALSEQDAALESGDLQIDAGEGDMVTGVVDSSGELIVCNGKSLLVENQGAGKPIAYLEGERESAVTQPGGVVEADASGVATSNVSYAARCSASGDAAAWKTFGG